MIFKRVGAYSLCALISVLAGCSSVSEVTKIGPDRYMVGSQVRGGLTSWAEVKRLALQRANSHCESLGQQLISSNTETHGVRGWTPQEVSVTFECSHE